MTDDNGTLRSFTSGATRDTNEGKLDYEGFLSPAVLRQFARYMNMNRLQSDGELRASDNWQKGIPLAVYMKSLYRHFEEMWYTHRMQNVRDRELFRPEAVEFVGAICGLMFNAMGYLHETLKTTEEVRFDDDEPTAEMKERQDNLTPEKNCTEEDEFGPVDLTEVSPDYLRRTTVAVQDLDPGVDHADIMNRHGGKSECTCIDCRDSVATDVSPGVMVPLGGSFRSCGNCKFLRTNPNDHPCDCCGDDYSNFVAKEG